MTNQVRFGSWLGSVAVKLGAVACVVAMSVSASAQNLYWDSNGTTLGAGATPTGIWGVDNFWNTDPTGGAAGAFQTSTLSTNDVFFSAGSDAVNPYTVGLNSATQNARLVTFKDGTATLNTGTLSLGTGGGITVTANTVTGATVSSGLTISGTQTFNVDASRTLTLNTGTFTRNTNSTLSVQGTGAVNTTMTGLGSASLVNGIIGPWASHGTGTSARYATVDGSSNIVAYTGGTAAATAANVTSTLGTVNYDVAAVGTLGAGANVNTLRYTGATGTIAGALTTNGIMNSSGNTLTFSGAVTGGSSGQLVLDSGSGTIAFGAATAAGSYDLVKTGAGRVNLANADTTYSGNVIVNQGVLFYGDNPARLTSGNVALNGGVIEQRWNGAFTKTQGTGAGQIQILGGESGFSQNGSTGYTVNIGAITWGSSTFNPTKFVLQTSTSQGTSSVTVSSAINLNGAERTIIANAGASGTASSTLSGVISNSTGTAGLIKEGAGRLNLTQTNTFNGPVTVTGGSLFVSVLANGGSNSGLGSSSAAASNIVLANGTTLGYTGGAVSSNRSFTINGTAAGHGASLDASGSGAVNFTNTSSPAYGTVDQTRTLTLTGTSAFNNTLAASVADNGTGAVSLTKSNTGAWFLSGVNAYTGPTTITGGTLVLSGATSLPGGIATAGGTSALVFNGGVLGLGAGDFTRSLDTAATVTAANFTGAGGWAAYNADRQVNLGGAGSTITWATANTGFNAQTLLLGSASATHNVTLVNPLNLGTAARTVQVADGAATTDATLSGDISSGAAGGLTKTGTGVLAVSGTNTYAGATTVNAGVLLLNSVSAIPGGIAAAGGTGPLVFTGGVIGLGNGDFSRPLNTNATNGAVNFTNAGGWAAYGANRTVNLGGANTAITWATANTGFNNQTLILGAASATHAVTLTNPLVVTTQRTVQVDNGAATVDAILSGAISGTSGGIRKIGSGTLLISGDMSNTGGLELNGGTLTLSGTNTYSGNTNFSSAGVQLIFAGTQAVSPNTIFVMNTNASTSDSSAKLLDDTGGVNNSTVTAPSTFRIQNNNSPGNAHTFIVGNNNTANGGTSSGTTTGSTIAIGTLGWGSYASGTTAYGPIQIQGTNGYRLQINSVVLHNAANLTSGTVGQTTFNPTTANATFGTVTVGTGNTGQGFQTLVLDGTSSDNRVTGIISDASDVGTSGRPLRVTKSNTSIWTLSGASTYSGTTSVAAGTLIGTNATQSFGTNLSGITVAAVGTLSLRNDSSVTFTNGTSAYNIANSASGATVNVDRVTGTGSNTITVGNLTTTSNAVTWQLNFTGANGVGLSAGALTTPTAAAGSHTINNTIAGGGALTLASVTGGGTGASATLIFGGTGNTTVTGEITQAATAQALTKNGAGTLALNGTSAFTGITTINLGVVEASVLANGSSNSSIGASSSAATSLVFGSPAATLRYVGGSDVTSNRSFTMGGGVGGGATIESSGLGTLSFDNAVALAYGTNNQTRTLTLGGTNTGLNTFGKVIANNGSGATTLVKSGVGRWVLDQANTYTGGTTVSGGTLVVNNTTGSGTGTGAVTISSLATLGGNGTISGALTVNGSIAPGNSIGVLNVANDVTWNGSASSPWVFELDTGNAADLLNITGGASDFLKGTGTGGTDFVFDFATSTEQGIFDLVTWGGNTTFTESDFSYQNLGGGNTGTFQISSNTLQFIVVPEPAAVALATCGLIGLGLAAHRRFRRKA